MRCPAVYTAWHKKSFAHGPTWTKQVQKSVRESPYTFFSNISIKQRTVLLQEYLEFSLKKSRACFQIYLERKEVRNMKDTFFSKNSYIFRPYITLKNGTRIYAKYYGKRAFRIDVRDEHNE